MNLIKNFNYYFYFIILFIFILFISLFTNFSSSFTIFHNILFNNNYWIFNPIKDSVILDDNRIKQSLETINYCIEKQAKVILMSHLGRIKEEKDKEQHPLCERHKENRNLCGQPESDYRVRRQKGQIQRLC